MHHNLFVNVDPVSETKNLEHCIESLGQDCLTYPGVVIVLSVLI